MNIEQKMTDPAFSPLPAETPMAEEKESIQIKVTEEIEKKIVQMVKEDHQSADDARMDRNYGTTSKGENIDFDKWYELMQDTYNGERIAKTIPWKYCSNRSLKMARSVLDLLHARLLPMIVNEDMVKWKAQNISSFPKLERIDKFMYWWTWVRASMREYFDIWVKSAVGFGEALTETNWKATPQDSGVTKQIPIMGPTGEQLVDPSGELAFEKWRDVSLFEKTESRLYMPDKVFLQKGSKDIQSETVILAETILFRDLENGVASGAFVNIDLLKEKLPYSKPAGVDEEESESLRNIRLRNHPVEVLKAYMRFDADGDGFDEDMRVMIVPEFNMYISGVEIKNLTKSGRRPLDFTPYETRLGCPDENWGIGILEVIRELCEEIDAIYNQLTDSNSLSILRPGFYDPSGDIKATTLTLAPNKLTPVSDPQRNVYFPDMQINIANLIQSIQMVLQFIERLTAASSYALGKESEIVGGSGTATRTNAIMQSAEQRFAIPAQRLRAGAARILRQHLDLIQLNIPPGLEQEIINEKGEPLFGENELNALSISGQFDCFILPDPSMGSKETDKQVWQLLYSLLIQNPLIASDPVKLTALTAGLIKSTGKEPQLILGPLPDMDQVDDPDIENSMILEGAFKDVKAQLNENHLYHIKQHSELLQSPTLAQLPPHLAAEISQYLQMHLQEHQQMMMQIMQMQAMQQKGMNGDGGAGTESNAQGTQGATGNTGLEQAPGPLGQALDASREGKVGGVA